MSLRIKGQEVQVLLTRAGVLEDSLTDILNFNVEFVSETKEQGYVGQKNDQTDDVFKNVKFDLEFHSHTPQWLIFLKAVHNRQKRITPNLIINISAVLFYPSGETPTITLPDCKFGPLPLNIGARADYVKKKLQGMCDDYDLDMG